ncbi:MAG: co-chaperone GroES [Candidatus Cloacimonetes bacterium 4572_65]|nr:MAG: co-chaperone GroES [Candidatus Cloacimonetes bacterium 4572_65]
MILKPIDDRVVIKLTQESKEKKIGNLYIPDSAKETPQIGEIIAVGNDEDLQEIVKVGDNVLYAKYGGNEVEIENNKYLIISRSDILAIVEK